MSAVFAQQKKRLLCAVMRELNSFKSIGITAVGTVDQLKAFCKQVGKQFAKGLRLIPALE